MPLELAIYRYRKIFHLSHKQVQDEPVDQLFLNLDIYAMLEKKRASEMKYAGK